MKKRLAALLLCALLLVSLSVPSRALEGAVEDLAYVLSPELIAQVQQLDDWLHQRLNFRLHVITRDFLGGTDAQVYADALLEFKHGDDSMLLLMVIGEERYALALGSRVAQLLDGSRGEHLLTSHFREPFLKDRDYDRALAAFLVQATIHLAGQSNLSPSLDPVLLSIAGMSGQVVAKSTAVPASEGSWLDSIFGNSFDLQEHAKRFEDDVYEAARPERGRLSLFQIALIGFILYKIFGKKRKGGGGCGPLSWIFGTWGLAKFFGWRK